jgi:hypothetical protein
MVVQAAAADEPTAPRVLNDDGGWCWFEDERAVWDQSGGLVFGTVASGHADPGRKGSIEVTRLDPKSGAIERATLHPRFNLDDHNSPALWVRPDGRILAMYAKHGPESKVYVRITEEPGSIAVWGPEFTVEPSATSRITYSNLHYLKDENGGRGRLYDFFRGLDNTFKPSWMTSDDLGRTWTRGGVLITIEAKFRHRPYVKYASDGAGTVHVAFTDAHPRDFDNSIYHVFIRDGVVHRSDGAAIGRMADGPIPPSQATRVFAGDPANVAWIQDIHLDSEGRPALAYSVQKDSAGLPPRQGGSDHRYRVAKWDGANWDDREVAYAGRRLYAGEDDYTGGICLDPQDLGTAYIATIVEPETGRPNASGHFEIYRGRASGSSDGLWAWEPITSGSTADNLRPIVPIGPGRPSAVLWLRGRFTTYTDYALEVVGRVPAR